MLAVILLLELYNIIYKYNKCNKLQATFGPKSVAYKKKNCRQIFKCCIAKEDNRLFKTFPYKKRTTREKNANFMKIVEALLIALR